MKRHLFQRLWTLLLLGVGWTPIVLAQDFPPVEKFDQPDKFRQLEEILPTPNDYRTASGAPGKEYWQQTVDYKIKVEINDEDQTLVGSEVVTYRNFSPDPLRYLWLQLDANIHAPNSDAQTTAASPPPTGMPLKTLQTMQARRNFDGSLKIRTVVDHETNNPLKFTIVKTMMRIDLPEPLQPQQAYTFRVDWQYAINNSRIAGGRSGYEFFEKDKNYLYELAQWYPRACAYTDVNGWQHKQYLGRGEFTLEFGNYEVAITVPDDHIVAATGELTNGDDVLTAEQRDRLQSARSANRPMFVVTPEEARSNEESPGTGKKTWVFRAENVRDFAFASSRKFIWDAMGVPVGDRTVLAMSFYPNEGEPLWSKYSTEAVAHTLEVYSRMTFDYPYPVAISVNGPVGGMEYPMICFNGPRPEADGTYSSQTKYGLISVVIHEVGHNWFPMIVNSDERQWTWMDEGLNTFLQVLAEAEWEEKYPSRRGDPRSIAAYMASAEQVPIMTNSESVLQFGNNAYAKPAAALTVLRETILGRELFDFAFREYAERWKFKRPMPADFFRTMEDASGVDLDWFWRGWFYSTDHVDLAIDQVRQIRIDTQLPYVEKPKQSAERDSQVESLLTLRNKDLPKRVDRIPELRDFYNEYDPLKVTDADREAFEKMLDSLSAEERALLGQLPFLYQIDFSNRGGLVMPLIVELEFDDGSKNLEVIPAEIWRTNNEAVSKMFMTEKRVVRVRLDPRFETADTQVSNNVFPPEVGINSVPMSGGDAPGGRRGRGGPNPMREAQKANNPNESPRSPGAGGSGNPAPGGG